MTVNGDLALTSTLELDNQAIALAKQSTDGDTTGSAPPSRSTSSTTRRRAGIVDGTALNGVDDLTITATTHRHDDDDGRGRRVGG